MSEPRIIVIEAISRRQTLEGRYNGTIVQLAPHMLFERHGDLFIQALNLGKQWREDEEPRLGQFKLAGLGDLSLTGQAFDPLAGIDHVPPRPGDTVVLTV